MTEFWSSWMQKVHLGGHFGHFVKTSRPKAVDKPYQAVCVDVAWTLLQGRIMSVGFLFCIALVKPNGVKTTWVWSTSFMSLMGHLWRKVHIGDPDRPQIFCGGNAHILRGLADFEIFVTIISVLIIFFEEKCQKLKKMHENWSNSTAQQKKHTRKKIWTAYVPA